MEAEEPNQIRRESLVLYKSFNTLGLSQAPKCHFIFHSPKLWKAYLAVPVLVNSVNHLINLLEVEKRCSYTQWLRHKTGASQNTFWIVNSVNHLINLLKVEKRCSFTQWLRHKTGASQNTFWIVNRMSSFINLLKGGKTSIRLKQRISNKRKGHPTVVIIPIYSTASQ